MQAAPTKQGVLYLGSADECSLIDRWIEFWKGVARDAIRLGVWMWISLRSQTTVTGNAGGWCRHVRELRKRRPDWVGSDEAVAHGAVLAVTMRGYIYRWWACGLVARHATSGKVGVVNCWLLKRRVIDCRSVKAALRQCQERKDRKEASADACRDRVGSFHVGASSLLKGSPNFLSILMPRSAKKRFCRSAPMKINI